MKPIYKPKGRASEYGEFAINIYTGCPHRCYYCFAPRVLHKTREEFYSNVKQRKDIVEATKRQIEDEGITRKLIHLCFACDPYPADIDTTVTREVIRVIKESGNNVQILTKGGYRAERDFDLLGPGDWFGVTITGNETQTKKYEPGAASRYERLDSLLMAHTVYGIKTWVSCEPVFSPLEVFYIIETPWIDLVRIGKLNYESSNINWQKFGQECERLCRKHNRNYFIKGDLREEMECVRGTNNIG